MAIEEKWRASGNYIYTGDPPRMIARFNDIDGEPYLERTYLAAAAPYLLDACKDLCDLIPDSIEFGPDWPDLVEAWEDAIIAVSLAEPKV